MAGSLNGGFQKKTEKKADFAKGGNTPMFGKGDRTTTAPKDGAHSMGSGTTDPGATGSGAGTSDKFAKGGSGKMFGYEGAVPATAGQTGAR
jgi:membrane protein involved in colicin uptake